MANKTGINNCGKLNHSLKNNKMKGLEIMIADIPGYVVTDHHEVYPYWEKKELRKTVLMHVDAHPDMNYAPITTDSVFGPTYELGIANFITCAFFSKMISSIYWYDPHVENRNKLIFVGAREGSFRSKQNPLISMIYDGYIQLHDPKDIHRGVYIGDGEIVNAKEVIPGELILDIDLDAFCCYKRTQNPRRSYDSVNNWNDRIEKMIKILAEIQRPKCITIARSCDQEDSWHKSFVPYNLVDKVQEDTIDALNNLYK